MAYEFGTALLNYERFDVEQDTVICLAIPFWTATWRSCSDVLDDPIEKPKVSTKTRNPITQHCKRVKKIGKGGKLYTVDAVQLNSLMEDLTSQYNTVRDGLCAGKDLLFVNKFSKVNNGKYIVKVQRASTLRLMMTGLKEVHATNEVYKTSWATFNGEEIVPEVVMGCPLWNGRRWVYVVIMEKVSGVPLSKVCSLPYRVWNGRKYNKKRILDTVTKMVSAFWALGYAHNDLHWDNIMYDIKTDTAKIIDLECCVRLPDDSVTNLREDLALMIMQSILNGDEENNDQLSYLFSKHYKPSALSLLYVATQYCERYADAENIIYNTDEHLLPMLSDLL